MNKVCRKYIDRKMITKIEQIQKEYEDKGKYCSFSKASRILAGRL